MMAQAGVSAAAQETEGLLLNGQTILSLITPGSHRPITGFRASTDGIAKKAEGSTQAPLTFIALLNDQWHTGHPITGADYEIYFDSLTNTATGQAGTWFGDARDTFLGLNLERTWTWQKDTTADGTASHQIIITIRNIATPADTTGGRLFTFISEISP